MGWFFFCGFVLKHMSCEWMLLCWLIVWLSDEMVLHSTGQVWPSWNWLLFPHKCYCKSSFFFCFFYYITSSSFQVKHVYFLCFKLINKHLIYFWTLIEVYSFFNSSMFNILCEHFDGLFYSYLYATLWEYASHHSTTAGSLNPQLLCCLSALVW